MIAPAITQALCHIFFPQNREDNIKEEYEISDSMNNLAQSRSSAETSNNIRYNLSCKNCKGKHSCPSDVNLHVAPVKDTLDVNLHLLPVKVTADVDLHHFPAHIYIPDVHLYSSPVPRHVPNVQWNSILADAYVTEVSTGMI